VTVSPSIEDRILDQVAAGAKRKPRIEATDADCEALADIIWFIKGRLSVYRDRDASAELDGSHVEALRRFRLSFQAMKEAGQ
jgi:hypothetical protein